MLVERTELTLDETRAAAFDAAMADRGVPLLRSVPGALAVSFGRGVENPSKFLLLVTWQSMDAHKEYNKTPACTELRRLIGDFAPASAAMEHFELN